MRHRTGSRIVDLCLDTSRRPWSSRFSLPCPPRRRRPRPPRASGNDITITGDDGPNVISVNNVGDFIMYEDKSGPNIVAGDGCFQENPSLINCGVGGVRAEGHDDARRRRRHLRRPPRADRLAGRRPRRRRRQRHRQRLLRQRRPARRRRQRHPARHRRQTTRSTVAPATTRSTAEPTTTRSSVARAATRSTATATTAAPPSAATTPSRRATARSTRSTCGWGADSAGSTPATWWTCARLRSRRPADRRTRRRQRWSGPTTAPAALTVALSKPRAHRAARAGGRQGPRRHRDHLAAVRGDSEARRERGGGAARQARAQGGAHRDT